MALHEPPLQPCLPHPQASSAPLCPPRVLAKGPYWARLPALLASTHAASEGLSQGPFAPSAVQGSSVPPIVLPDRIGTTRVLLHDTQACIQKFAARMDVLGTHIDQALKEVQLARAALEISGEKTVADVVDVVYKCQASLVKSIETQGNALEKTGEKISQLISTNDALVRLYDAHHSSLNLLLQTSHTHTNAIQALQTQQCQNLAALAPLEALIKAVPVHVDASQSTFLAGVVNALGPAMEKAVESGIERALAKKLLLSVDAQPQALDKDVAAPARGKKRKRVANDDPPSDTVSHPPLPRRPSVAAAHEHDTATNKPSESSNNCGTIIAPVLRQLASHRTTARPRSRGSMRHPSVQPAPEMRTKTPELRTRADEREIYVNAPRPPSLSRELPTRQFTLPISGRKPISGVLCRTRTRSFSHTRASIINNVRIDTEGNGLSSTTSVNVNSDITLSLPVYAPEHTAPRHPVLPSLGQVMQENRAAIIDGALHAESDGFRATSNADVLDCNMGRPKGSACKSKSAKSKSKPKSRKNTNNTKPKGPGNNKKGKKASSATLPAPCPPPGVANPDTAVISSKGANSNRTSSDNVETSVASEHAPPDGLSRAFTGKGIQPAVANNATTAVEGEGNEAPPIQDMHMTNVQAIPELTSATAPERQTQVNIRESSLVPCNVSSLSLLNMGGIFSSPTHEGRIDALEDSDADVRLAAALAHVHDDIDFTGQGAYTQVDSETRSQADSDNAHNNENNLDNIGIFGPPRPSVVRYENTPRKNARKLFNQPKRFLLDGDSSEIDLCFGGLSD
ncbi:hypothetical protein M0805_005105 [Coniferiporia weirii]|nr:hypothetical protein M0805_005105 [Coniferiporia weirii]